VNPLKRLVGRWWALPVAVSLLVLLVLGAGLGVIFQYERTYRIQKLSETTVQAEILAASVTAALDFRDSGAAQEAVSALRVNQQINAAGVYDANGALFAGYERRLGTLPRTLSQGPAEQGNLIEAVVPVLERGDRLGTVYLTTVREPVSRRVTRYSVIGLLVVMAALVVAVLGFATAALGRANRQLAERATALGEAYEQLKVEAAERANAEAQLRQAQKMQALGQLTGGIAHDFNNLLTVIQGSADVLRRSGLSEEKRVRFADAIVQTAGRAAALTGQLLAFARRQPLQPETIDINERITAMTDLLDRTLGERIEVRTELADDLCAVIADPAQLESAVINIAVNARDAMPDGGVLTIRTEETSLPDSDHRAVALSLTDTGAGIEPEVLARVFEPFFTTKAVGRGTGLGLSQVYGFAAQSGGDVRLESEPGKGTTVAILLPCTDQPADKKVPLAPSASVHRTGRVLVVDDNEEVGAFAETLLAELGHRVTRARTAAEALEWVDRDRFDVVFTDVVMPGMSGLELAEALRIRHPDLRVVLTTGYSDEVMTSGTGGLPVVFKPYRLEMLATALDQALWDEQRSDIGESDSATGA
jgi:signal transduction histidine kinase/ActR/RegA family two-component response regulator